MVRTQISGIELVRQDLYKARGKGSDREWATILLKHRADVN